MITNNSPQTKVDIKSPKAKGDGRCIPTKRNNTADIIKQIKKAHFEKDEQREDWHRSLGKVWIPSIPTPPTEEELEEIKLK